MRRIEHWAGTRDLDFRHCPQSGMGAVFSRDHSCRYLLWRIDHLRGRLLGIGMLNPSTASETADDPTIARCRRIARRLRFPGLLVWNLFAHRATDPADLRRAADPLGPDNDEAIALALELCRRTILAWGNHGTLAGRSASVREMLATSGSPLATLGLTGCGEPRHPLYLPAATRPRRWNP